MRRDPIYLSTDTAPGKRLDMVVDVRFEPGHSRIAGAGAVGERGVDRRAAVGEPGVDTLTNVLVLLPIAGARRLRRVLHGVRDRVGDVHDVRAVQTPREHLTGVADRVRVRVDEARIIEEGAQDVDPGSALPQLCAGGGQVLAVLPAAGV